jgi:hypothetical protein
VLFVDGNRPLTAGSARKRVARSSMAVVVALLQACVALPCALIAGGPPTTPNPAGQASHGRLKISLRIDANKSLGADASPARSTGQ